MENRAHMEAPRGPGATIVDRIRRWTRDNLTVRGRENAIYQKKYDEVLKNLPKDMNDQQMALIEMRLQRMAHSRAIGSIVADVAFAGTAIVGTGMLLNRLADKQPFLSDVQRRNFKRMEKRGKQAANFVGKVIYGGVKLGADLTVGVVDVALAPARALKKAGQWVWGATLGGVFETNAAIADKIAAPIERRRAAQKAGTIIEKTTKEKRFTRWVRKQDEQVMRLHRDMVAEWYNTSSKLRSKEPPSMDEAIQAFLKKKKVI